MINPFRRQDARQPEVNIAYPALPAGQIVYVVGDIHGRSELLDRVHAAIDRADHREATSVTEIYLGDYVDRGADSRGVIERLLSRGRSRQVVCLRGNHEDMFERFLHGEFPIEDWKPAGGIETLMSYGVDPRPLMRSPNEAWVEAAHLQVPAEHHRFLLQLVDSHRIGAYFFVHAGVRPGVALDAQSADDLLWIRDSFLGVQANFGAIVVHGHTPTVTPEFRVNRINIDTGAYLTNRLTCLRIDETGPRIFV